MVNNKKTAHINNTAAEAAAGTIKADAHFEVPGAVGAKAVLLTHASLELPHDLSPAVATADSWKGGALIVGKTTPTTINLSTPGAVLSSRNEGVSNGTIHLAKFKTGADQFEGAIEVPKDPDGKYYVTLAAHSGNCATACSVTLRADFIIVE